MNIFAGLINHVFWRPHSNYKRRLIVINLKLQNMNNQTCLQSNLFLIVSIMHIYTVYTVESVEVKWGISENVMLTQVILCHFMFFMDNIIWLTQYNPVYTVAMQEAATDWLEPPCVDLACSPCVCMG